MRSRTLIAGGVVAVIAVAAAVAIASARSGGVYAGPGHTSAANKAAAKADAAELLTRVQLPPGATLSSTEPAGDGGTLRRPPEQPATPNLVDEHAWWTVSGTAADVLAYVNAHPPPGAKLTGSLGPSSPPVVMTVEFGWPPVPNVLQQRSLAVTVVQLPHNVTGVRTDGSDIWITPRPAAERVPAAADRLRVTVFSGTAVTQAPLTFTSRSRVRAAAAVINSLPLFPPGAYNCPADFGITVRLEFFEPRLAAPAAVAIDDPAGCSEVNLRVGDHRYPQLAGWGFPPPDATHRLERALGVHLRTRPPGP
jgi:hypothetical protein